MSEPVSGYAYRPEEPQCYNCGAKGHWAVACPEPTRVTPAGLAAWKSSSSASHGNHRNQHGGSRRGNKGPIITKYAHPPPPVGHGLNQYPAPPPPPPPPLQSLPLLPPPTPPTPTPLPGHHQAPCQPYSGPTPAYHPHPPPYVHYPPPSPYPPSYHQPGYLTPHPLPHAPPQPPPHYAPPPVHYGVPQVAPSSYPTHPPGPSGSQVPVPQMPVPYPPAYSPYPPARPPDPMSYGQQPTYHPPAYPPLPAYGSQPAPYPSPVASGPISGPGPAPISPPIVQVHKPPAASQLPSQSIHHSLPPKPPRSRHLNPEPQREHRHKKRYDRQNRNRDNRQKDQSYTKRQGGKKQPPAQAKPNVSPTGNSVKFPTTGMHEKENVTVEKSPEKSPPPPRKDESRNEDGDCEEARAEDEPQPRDSEEREAQADSDEDWEWDLKFIFREPEAAHNPDEVGVPLPEMYCEDALLPRPFTMVCIESKFVTPENVEEFTKPIREQAYWHVIKFDPAFVQDGRLAGGEPLPTQNPRSKTPDSPSKTMEGHVDEEDRAARGRKRKEGWAERAERAEQDRRHHKKSKMVEEGGEQKLPDPTASPSRSRQRRRRSNGSKGSRNSSVTSRSSDLNSLEAELLGRPTRRSPSDGDARHRQSPSKPKRRRRPADSAYGRRW